MWPKTLNELIGFITFMAGAVFAVLQTTKWYFGTIEEKFKSKDAIELEKTKVDLAKYRDNILSAAQVMELMKSTNEVKEEIAIIKAENEDRSHELTRAMDKLEMNLKHFEETFTKFLIARLNQFDKL